MPPIHHRDPGVIGLLGDPARSPYYGIIVDGLHSHPNTVRIAYGAKKDGCILVTDGMLSWIAQCSSNRVSRLTRVGL